MIAINRGPRRRLDALEQGPYLVAVLLQGQEQGTRSSPPQRPLLPDRGGLEELLRAAVGHLPGSTEATFPRLPQRHRRVAGMPHQSIVGT